MVKSGNFDFMGKKLDKYTSILSYIRRLEAILERRIKEGNYGIEVTWTSDGRHLVVTNDDSTIEPDGSQTFTFKFGPGS